MQYNADVSESNKKATTSITAIVYNVLLFVSALFTAQFINHIAQMASHLVWHGEQYAAQTYEGVLALVVCVYIWAKTSAGYQRYIAAVLASALIIGYAVWLLGKFGLAGKYYLQTSN